MLESGRKATQGEDRKLTIRHLPLSDSLKTTAVSLDAQGLDVCIAISKLAIISVNFTLSGH